MDSGTIVTAIILLVIGFFAYRGFKKGQQGGDGDNGETFRDHWDRD